MKIRKLAAYILFLWIALIGCSADAATMAGAVGSLPDRRIGEVMVSGGSQRLFDVSSKVLQEYLTTHTSSFHYELANSKVISDFSISESMQLQARSIRGSQLHKKMTVFVDVVQNGNVIRSIPVVYEVEAVIKAWKVRKTMLQGALITRDDLELALVDATKVIGSPATEKIDLESQPHLLRMLLAGTTLLVKDYDFNSEVYADGSVLIEYDAGSIKIEAYGIALRSGKIGDMIKVKVAGDNVSSDALVVGKNRVRVGEM